MAQVCTPAPHSALRAERRRSGQTAFSLQQLTDCLENIGARTQQLETTTRNIESKLDAMSAEQSKTTNDHHTQMARLDTLLQAKAGDEQLRQMKQDLVTSETHIVSLQQSMLSFKDRMLHLDQAVAASTKAVEAAVLGKAESTEMRQLEGTVAKLESDITILNGSLKERADIVQVQELSQAISDIKADAEDVQKMRQSLTCVEETVDAGKKHITLLQQAIQREMQSKASCLDMDALKIMVEDGRSRIAGFECALDQCVRLDELTGLNAAIKNCHAQIVHAVESTQGQISALKVEDIRQHTAEVQDMVTVLEEVVTDRISHLRQLDQKVTSMDSMVKNLQQSLHKKGQSHHDDLSRLQGIIDGMQATMSSLLESCSEARDSNRVHALEKALKRLETQFESFESPACLAQKFDKLENALMTGSDRVHDLEDSVAEIKTRVNTADHHPREVQGGHVQDVSRSIESFHLKMLDMERDIRQRVKDLQQVVSEKTSPGAADLRQLQVAVSSLQSQMAGLRQFPEQDNVNMDSVQQLKACVVSVQAQMNTLQQDLHEKPGVDQLQKLKLAITSMQANLTGFEQRLQGALGSEQGHQLNSAMAGVFTKINTMAQDKADVSNLQQLNETVLALQSRVPTKEQVQQLERTVTNLGKHITQIEQSKSGKLPNSDSEQMGFASIHTQVELQHFKGIIAGMEKKVTDVEQDLQDKVSNGQLQQVRKQMVGLDTKIIGVEQLMQEKAAAAQVQSLQGSLQAQLTTIETAVQEKLGADQLQPLKGTIASVQAQVASVEQSLNDKVGTNQMQQLKGSIARTESKVSSLDQAVQEKAEVTSGQMQQLKDAVSGVQSKVAGLNQAAASRVRAITDTALEAPRAAAAADGLQARIKRLRGQ